MINTSDKFGRTYSLQVETHLGTTIAVTLPFTIEFDITKNTLTSANVCQIRIYNLSLQHRNQIRHNATDYGTYQKVSLFAGYGANPPLIFSGNISAAWSVREGVNFITQIECYDGGFAFVNGVTDTPMPEGTPRRVAIETIADQIPHATVGAVGNTYLTIIPRGNSYSGNSMQILNDLTGGGVFIDNEKIYCLATNEYVIDPSGVQFISSASGLLGTPLLEQTIVHFDIVFEPTLFIGRSVLLQSLTENNFTGLYKVVGVKHRGMISEAVCGSVITTGQFFYNNPLLGVPAT